MAVLTEVSVTIVLTAYRESDGSVRVEAKATSLAADGQPIRQEMREITQQLTGPQLTGAANLLTTVEGLAKTRWSIP